MKQLFRHLAAALLLLVSGCSLFRGSISPELRSLGFRTAELRG